MSGSGLMPCVPCVLPCPGTHCNKLVCVGAAVACQCLCVSSDGVFAVPVGCDRKRRVLARLCRAVHGLHGRQAVPGRAGAGTVLFGRVG